MRRLVVPGQVVFRLDEPQELNLLASVGNTYNLHRPQQSAVLHDRGQRKPWESARNKRTHTAHVLTPEDDLAGLQSEGPYVGKTKDRKAKKGNSKVASQSGVLVTFADRGALNNDPGNYSIADWKSRAGQRVCRSTFGAETQACAEGLGTAQYMCDRCWSPSSRAT